MRISLFIFISFSIIVGCKSTSENTISDPGSNEDQIENMQPNHPTSMNVPTIRKDGFVIPIFFEEDFKEALKAAEQLLGPKSHGLWFWDRDGKYYNLEGVEHLFE